MLVRYRGINNKGVLERPWTKWGVLRAISTTLKCQFTGKCRKVDFLTSYTTKSAEKLHVGPYDRYPRFFSKLRKILRNRIFPYGPKLALLRSSGTCVSSARSWVSWGTCVSWARSWGTCVSSARSPIGDGSSVAAGSSSGFVGSSSSGPFSIFTWRLENKQLTMFWLGGAGAVGLLFFTMVLDLYRFSRLALEQNDGANANDKWMCEHRN